MNNIVIIKLIKDITNIQTLPLDVWKYIIYDFTHLPFILWRNRMGRQCSHINKTHQYIKRNSYNIITKLHSTDVFRRTHEKSIALKELKNYETYHIITNYQPDEYIMPSIRGDTLVF